MEEKAYETSGYCARAINKKILNESQCVFDSLLSYSALLFL